MLYCIRSICCLSTLADLSFSPPLLYSPLPNRCGHCKAFKPGYQEAAEELKDNKKVRLAAIDCTVNQAVASEFKVTGYPTLKYFSYGKYVEDFSGPRTKEGLIEFFDKKENAA